MSDRTRVCEVLVHILHAPDHLHPPHHIVTQTLKLWVFISVPVENCATLSVHFLLGESQTKLGHIGSGFNITRRSDQAVMGSIRWKITPTVFHLSLQHAGLHEPHCHWSQDGSLVHPLNSLAVILQESFPNRNPTDCDCNPHFLSDYFAHYYYQS